MRNLETLEKIKKLTIAALVSDDLLMGILVLKGGNALNLAYDITNRGSVDIDFSMEKDFSELEKKRIQNQIGSLLNSEFSKQNLTAFDIRFTGRPNEINEAVSSFWGGYQLEFKVIETKNYIAHNGNFDAIRRNALPIHSNDSPKFTVDISKYEYVAEKKAKDIEGAIVYVYTPEMLAIEKLRALCQQIPSYRDIVFSMTSKPRARDFYDIYSLVTSFTLSFDNADSLKLIQHIFEAKKVPLSYIKLIQEQREFHRQGWESVINTVNQKEKLGDYDYYFDYVMNLFSHLS